MDYQNFGQRVKQLRNARKLTQSQLAERVGITDKYMSRIETDGENITIEILINLANVLEVDANYLLQSNIAACQKPDQPENGQERELLHLQVDSLSESEIRFFSECSRLKRELGA